MNELNFSSTGNKLTKDTVNGSEEPSDSIMEGDFFITQAIQLVCSLSI